MEQGGFGKEPRFAGTAAADDQDIFVPGVLRLLRAARHRDTLRLCHRDVVEKILITKGAISAAVPQRALPYSMPWRYFFAFLPFM